MLVLLMNSHVNLGWFVWQVMACTALPFEQWLQLGQRFDLKGSSVMQYINIVEVSKHKLSPKPHATILRSMPKTVQHP